MARLPPIVGTVDVQINYRYPRLAWIARSRKAKIALGSVATIVLSRLLPKLGFSAADTNVISGSIVATAGVWIGSIAAEDAGAKSAAITSTGGTPVSQPGGNA